MKDLPIIGRSVLIDFDDDAKAKSVPARVDTGAWTSSVWASKIVEQNGTLSFVLFDEHSSFYSGQVLSTSHYRKVKVMSAFGDFQMRYVVKLGITLATSGVVHADTEFSLADRSKKRFPVLIGRQLLRGRYLVDSRMDDKGHNVIDEERRASKLEE